MLPPVSSKQLLCIRAISTMVFDKIASETVETNILSLSQVVAITPDNTIFIGIVVYSAYIYYSNTTPVYKGTGRLNKGEKLKQLSKYVLSDTTYDFIKVIILTLFLLIKDPKSVV
jgi:hypothetical protein